MAFVDHLKGAKPETLFLEVAFGFHIIAGDLTKSSVAGDVVTIQHMLGDAYGRGWQGPFAVWFRGITRPPAKYKFYPGIISPTRVLKNFTADNATDTITSTAHGFANGDMIIHLPGNLPAPLIANKIYFVRDSAANTYKVAATSGGTAINLTSDGSGTRKVFKNDPVQGVDVVFDQDTPHSNSAWMRVECPSGAEVGIPDPDTKTNPPTGLSMLMNCQLGDIYDETGDIEDPNVLITNPADVLSFGCIDIRRYLLSRVDWPVLAALRDFCNATEMPDYRMLPQGVGVTASYFNGDNFDTLIRKRVDPVIQMDLSAGAPEVGLDVNDFSARFEGWSHPKYTETFTYYVTHNDGAKLWVNGTLIVDQWASTGTHSGTAAHTADQFYEIKLEWKDSGGDAQIMLEWESATQTRRVIPQDRLYPKNELVKRFECHQRFTSPTNFDDFLRAILFTCNGAFQDVNGRLKFFSIDQLTPSFHFNETNIVKTTFKYNARFSQQELLSLPNRFVADGRDLNDRYLAPFDPPLFYDLPELQEFAGRINEEVVSVGNTTRWQALKNLAHYAKLRTSPAYCEFDGMPQTLSVLPGDLVLVSYANDGLEDKIFLVIEATERSIDRAPDNRMIKLLLWEEDVDIEDPSAPVQNAVTVDSHTAITMDWDAATDDVGVTSYEISYKETSSGTWGSWINVDLVLGYQVTGLTSDTAYDFRVRAKDAAAHVSVASNTQSGTTDSPPPPDTEAPTAPVQNAVTVDSDTEITMDWDASTDNVAVTSYEISYKETSSGVWGSWVNVGLVLSYQVAGLTEETGYDFRVRAKDAAANVSANSNTQSGTTDSSAELPPTNLTANITDFVSGEVTLDWTNQGGTGAIAVERRFSFGAWNVIDTIDAADVTYIDSLPVAGFFCYRVSQANADGYAGPDCVSWDGGGEI